MVLNINMTADQMLQAHRDQLARDLFLAEGFRNAYQAKVDELKQRIAAYDSAKKGPPHD